MSERSVLHVIHGLTVGGAEVDLVRKAAWMTSNAHCDATICCLMRRGELADTAEEAGVRVVGPLMRHRYDVTAAARLDGVLRSRDWSLVHSHIFAGNLVTWLVRSLRPGRRVPLVVSEHATAERWSSTVHRVQRRILSHARVFQVPSGAARESYGRVGLPVERIRVVPNSVERPPTSPGDDVRGRTRRALGIDDDTFVVGTVSRLQAIKGLEYLVDAIDAPDVVLVVAGDGPERARLERRARERGDRVRFLGTRHDVGDLLTAFDLFALHSFSESFAISVAEALRCGLPVVATNVGAIPEITGNGEFARLVPPGDSAALAEAIRWVREHRSQAEEAARRGSEHVAKRWSPEAASRAQLAVYDEVLRTGRG